MPDSNENLQYALLALVSGLEAYTKRKNQIDDVQSKRDYDKPARDMDMQYRRARIDSANALTDQREQRMTAPKESKDPMDEALKDVPQAQRMQAKVDLDEYFKKGKSYDEVLQMAHDRYGGVDKEHPTPEADPDNPPSEAMLRELNKVRTSSKNRHVQSLGALLKLQSKGYNPWAGQSPQGLRSGGGGAPMQAPQGQPQGFLPQGPMQSGQQFGADFGGGQDSRMQMQRPPGGASGGMNRLTGQVGPQTGGAKITPPRVPTADIAEQNFKAFANAPQGPLANMGDQRDAGTVAKLWTVVLDENLPFEHQAAAWFKLHDLLPGVPVPDVFQQYAVGLGIPRSVIDAMSSQGGSGSNWYQGRGENAPGNVPPEALQQIEQAIKRRPRR